MRRFSLRGDGGSNGLGDGGGGCADPYNTAGDGGSCGIGDGGTQVISPGSAGLGDGGTTI